MKNPLLSRRSSSNPDSCSAQWIAMVAIVTARMCEGVSRCRGWRCAVCAPRGIRVTMPRTLAPDRGDGVGVPEIASRVPPLPNRDGLRRMRGTSFGLPVHQCPLRCGSASTTVRSTTHALFTGVSYSLLPVRGGRRAHGRGVRWNVIGLRANVRWLSPIGGVDGCGAVVVLCWRCSVRRLMICLQG